MPPDPDHKSIIIIGGGIIGCTTAYFLTRHPSFDPARHTVTLLEATKIAGGASGKAGGLLGLWAYPANIVPLSFRLHAELAKEHDGERRWGYRRIHVGQLEAKGRMMMRQSQGQNNQAIDLGKRDDKALGKLRAAGVPKDLDWVAPEGVRGYDEMGSPKDTAQVHPFHFTTSMADLAEQAGAKITLGARVKSINRSGQGKEESVESVTYVRHDEDGGGAAEETTLPATHVVVAAGPWTQRVLPSAPIQALRAHSVTIKPTRELSGYALFTSIQLPPGFDGSSSKMRSEHVTPEIYARPFDEVYACGDGDQLVPLPDTTKDVEVDDSRCQDIVDQVGSISDELRDGEVTARQACYLPTSGGSGPFIGEVRECKNLILAAGHAVWGIQNGPATGKLVSEIIMEGQAKSAKLGGLDPKRSL